MIHLKYSGRDGIRPIAKTILSGGRSQGKGRVVSANIKLWWKKNSRSEAERAFDCHILAPVKQLLN